MTEYIARGLYPAPIMPLTPDRRPDLDHYLGHCRRLIDGGATGLMPLGTTGEAYSFTIAEKVETMEALAGAGFAMDRMLVGTSALALDDAVTLTRHALTLGAGAVCVQPPFYYARAVTADGLYDFYARFVERVADSRLRLLIYDNEGMLGGIHFPLDLLGRLFADFADAIIGLKDSNTDQAQLIERARAFPDAEIFGGTDSTALVSARHARGSLSAFANIMPATFLDLQRDPHGAAGEAAQARIDQVRGIVARYPVFPALREVVALQTGDDAWRQPRPPLTALTADQRKSLARALQEIGMLERAAA